MKRRGGKRRRRRVLEQAETEESIRGYAGISVRRKPPQSSEMGSRPDATDRERGGRATGDVAAREERIDERGLVAPSVLDAQEPGARLELGRERFRSDETASATAREEDDARELPPTPSESRSE